MGCVGMRSPNYIFLFRLRQSRAITRYARKNPFADNALKRRVHGADSNYEHLYTYSFVGSYAALQHPIPTIAYISFSFTDCYHILLERCRTYTRFVVYVRLTVPPSVTIRKRASSPNSIIIGLKVLKYRMLFNRFFKTNQTIDIYSFLFKNIILIRY